MATTTPKKTTTKKRVQKNIIRSSRKKTKLEKEALLIESKELIAQMIDELQQWVEHGAPPDDPHAHWFGVKSSVMDALETLVNLLLKVLAFERMQKSKATDDATPGALEMPVTEEDIRILERFLQTRKA